MALVGLACSEANPELTPARGDQGLERCDLKGTLALCGQAAVWENRELESGRRIQLHYAVLRAYSASPARDAVFFLAGGPGQSAMTLAHDMAPLLEGVRRERDIVFLDQRGTGQSNALNCELADPNDPREQFRTDFDQSKLKQCVAALDADTTQYTTEAAVADLEDVRKALGYERVNLIGASYGTRLALAYARAHSSALRSMVLDGVAPPQLRLFLDFLPDGQRALDQAFDYCERNADCSQSYPSLRQDFAALMSRLERHPLGAKVRHPETGEELELTLTADAFASAVRGILAQRLVRRLCGDCKAPTTLTERELRGLGLEASQLMDASIMGPNGCPKCRQLGYRGRMTIAEIFKIDDEVRNMINEQLTTPQLRRRARELGMRTLREDGVRKVLAGMTTAEEVIEATMADSD